jgi:RNA polymerase sigma factor (sigma-70 family)
MKGTDMQHEDPSADSTPAPAARAATRRSAPKKASPERPLADDAMSRDGLERLFLAELPMIEGVIASLARKKRLSAIETEEFASEVHLRIISNDYAILRKFRAHSTLRTFLTVVIQRMFLDYRDAQWGKWRPSARSRREGDLGVLFERLTIRDGMAFEEACTQLEMTRPGALDRDALERIYAGFRQRGRPRLVNDELGGEAIPSDESADDGVVRAEERRALMQAIDALGAALNDTPAADYLILKLHFGDGLSLSAIARRLKLDQKWLYRRLARLLHQLRALVESAGVLGQSVLPVLGRADADPIGVFSQR